MHSKPSLEDFKAQRMGKGQKELTAVWVFALVTLALSVGLLFLPPQNGLDLVVTGWLMAITFGAAALVVIFLTRGRLGWPNENVQAPPVGYRASAVSD